MEEPSDRNPSESDSKANDDDNGEIDPSQSDEQHDSASDSEEDVQTPEPSEQEQGWSPSSDRPLAVVVRGTPERYDLHFIIIMVIDTRSDRENLLEVTSMAARDRDFIYQFDLEQPAEILKKAIQNERQRNRSKASPRDSRLVEEKFRSLFNKMMRGGNLGSQLRENDNESIRQFLHRKVSDECFPGTNIEVEIRLSPWEPAEVDQVDDEEEEEEEEESDDDKLEVSPVVHPLSGDPIGQLQPGDVFLVRVIGDSVMEIDPEHLKQTGEKVHSQPFKARMVRMEEGETPQEITFHVEIDDELEGKGMVTREVRVRSNEQLVRINKPIAFRVLKVFLVIISVFFAMSLSAIIFLY